jgi:glycosyltransferase involved in cell wall biosynthesis
MYKLIFWQGVMSIHQSALLRNLAGIPGIDVTLVVWEDIPKHRKSSGWLLPDFGNTHIIMKPSSQEQTELLSRNTSNSIHIFSGTRGYPMVWNVLRKSISSNTNCCIEAESQNGIGLKGTLRLLRSRYDAIRLREKVDVVLAIGSLGVNWYKKSGYFPNRIFPFGYFVETPIIYNVDSDQYRSDIKTVEIVFIGSPFLKKGLDILLSSLSGLKDLNWHLHVVGDGDDREQFLNMCKTLRLTGRVYFHGVIPNPNVIHLLSVCDLLVLPSRWDGWGAVINEALMCGVPVICSDKCGAADLIGDGRGHVFPSQHVPELQSALCRQILLGKKDYETSAKIKKWSQCIEGTSAATYFIQAMNAHVNGEDFPAPPWSK